MPLDIPQYHLDGIENRIWNSYQMMLNYGVKTGLVSPDNEVPYHIDYIEQTPDPNYWE
jgi:hypothetical protein